MKTKQFPFSDSRLIRRKWRILWILIPVFAISACNANHLTIRFLYSRVDNRIADRFEQYAQFDTQQKSWIRQSAKEFYQWHRSTQLPLYADFIEQIGSRINKSQPVSDDDMHWVVTEIDRFAEKSFQASPLPNSIEFLQSLSDDQVRQIEQKIALDNQKFLDRVNEQSEQDREDRQVRGISKFLTRLDISINEGQEQIIREGLRRYVGDRLDRFNAWNEWTTVMVDLLKSRADPSFPLEAKQHIAIYSNMMDTYHPNQTRINRQVTMNIVAEVINDFDTGQRDRLKFVLADTSKLFRSMARRSIQ